MLIRPFTAGVAADHAATLFPAALASDLMGGRAVLGHVSRVNSSCRSCCLIEKCYRDFST